MKFADLHIHALYGCDDGAKTEADMFRMVDMAYASGTRILCLTPHYHPGYFGENRTKSEEAFEHLSAYAADHYPDLELYLGNELRYDRAAASWLREGRCRTLNGSRYVLVDFLSGESLQGIEKGLHQLLNGGYVPILAHVERYRSLWGNTTVLSNLKNKGILFQMDAGAPLGEYGIAQKLWAKKLLKHQWVDLMSTDAHDLQRFRPELSTVYVFLKNNYGADYAERICWKNGSDLIRTMDGKG